MANYITIDGGTTNTRINLVKNNAVINTHSFNVGAKNSIDNKYVLKQTIKNCISDILRENSLSEKDVECILACGMITSEFGLIELRHIETPAGINEMHKNMHRCILKDITSIPFVFIRGVKTACRNIEDSDMMRGEESELIGIFSQEGIYILPGSHSKIIKADSLGRITDFRTMLTGEMISAISKETILKDAINLSDAVINKEYLIKGFKHTEEYGINEALFKVRILKNIFNANENEIYSFYMGIMLHDEIKYILSENPKRIFIGGRKAIKKATAFLLGEFGSAKITVFNDVDVRNSTTKGMIRIYEEKF